MELNKIQNLQEELDHEKEKQAKLIAQISLLEQQVNELKTTLDATLGQLQSTKTLLIEREKLATLGELTAGIAHEIQNPLNFVNNFAEVSNELLAEMEEEIAQGHHSVVQEIIADLKQNLEKINYHGKRTSSIVKNMLEHSRSSSGQKEWVDLNQLIDECMRLSYHGLKAQIKGFYVDYELHLDKNIPPIAVVSQDIGRVLLNLISNAFYAVDAKYKHRSYSSSLPPLVKVNSSKTDTGVLIQIADNGVGIPADIQAKIFQPFFTTKPTGEGTGLGLSLSYDIITKVHGGRISVESIEGEGSTFSIELPY